MGAIAPRPHRRPASYKLPPDLAEDANLCGPPGGRSLCSPLDRTRRGSHVRSGVPDLDRREVVTVFLLDRSDGTDRVLVARRSGRVSTYAGKWAAISGSIETGNPREDAIRELMEEAGLAPGGYEGLRQGEPLFVVDPVDHREWLVHPFLAIPHDAGAIRLNWEHGESRWVTPAEVASLDAVPGLGEALARVYP